MQKRAVAAEVAVAVAEEKVQVVLCDWRTSTAAMAATQVLLYTSTPCADLF